MIKKLVSVKESLVSMAKPKKASVVWTFFEKSEKKIHMQDCQIEYVSSGGTGNLMKRLKSTQAAKLLADDAGTREVGIY